MKMTIAAASAPTSGRARRREIRDRGSRFGASGLAGAAEGSVTTDELMDCSWEWWGGGGRGPPAPPGSGLPRGVFRGLDDRADVFFVLHRRGPGDRLGPPHVVSAGGGLPPPPPRPGPPGV